MPGVAVKAGLEVNVPPGMGVEAAVWAELVEASQSVVMFCVAGAVVLAHGVDAAQCCASAVSLAVLGRELCMASDDMHNDEWRLCACIPSMFHISHVHILEEAGVLPAAQCAVAN